MRSSGVRLAGACICVCGRPSADEDLHRNRCRRRQYEAFHARARDLRVDAEEVSEGGGGGGDPAVEEIFEGFLAIGTLGVGSWPIEEEDEAAIEEAQKESVELVVARAALETIAEKEAEATTETDLMVVETELEKVLAAEAERDGGRRSSAARSSHSGSSSACPLQGFLFGSSSEVAGAIEAEVADAAVAAGSYRKERRQSLAELFMMSRIAEEAAGRAKAAAAAPGVGSAVNWEEKATTDTRLLNKRTQKCSGWKGSDDADAADGSTPETKIQKVAQFNIHPCLCYSVALHLKESMASGTANVPQKGSPTEQHHYQKILQDC